MTSDHDKAPEAQTPLMSALDNASSEVDQHNGPYSEEELDAARRLHDKLTDILEATEVPEIPYEYILPEQEASKLHDPLTKILAALNESPETYSHTLGVLTDLLKSLAPEASSPIGDQQDAVRSSIRRNAPLLRIEDVETSMITLSRSLWKEAGKNSDAFSPFVENLNKALSVFGLSLHIPSVGEDYYWLTQRMSRRDTSSYQERGTITCVDQVGFFDDKASSDLSPDDDRHLMLCPKVAVAG